jgi:phenylacetyl-CoA:acceptor oxidoreductase subunit 2
VVLVVMAVLMPEALAYFAGLAGLAAMLAGWHIKFTIVTRAAYNQGYAIVHAPERGAGGGGPGTKPGWN